MSICVLLHSTNHWSRDTACWVARAMLHAVLEETERAFVKVEQYTYTVALIDVACCIMALLDSNALGLALAPSVIGALE